MLDSFTIDYAMVGSVFLRVLLSAFIGAFIGVDRVKKGRPAGIKTHALVCMGSALVMLTSEHLFLVSNGGTDIGRLSAQVISGVGFLGAGTIMVTGRNQIKGLTTAAGLWFAATLGLAIGIGFYSGVISAVILFVLITRIFSIYDYHLQSSSFVMDIYVELSNETNIGRIVRKLKQQQCHVNEIDRIDQQSMDSKFYFISLRLPHKTHHKTILESIETVEGVNFIDEI